MVSGARSDVAPVVAFGPLSLPGAADGAGMTIGPGAGTGGTVLTAGAGAGSGFGTGDGVGAAGGASSVFTVTLTSGDGGIFVVWVLEQAPRDSISSA